MSDEFPDAGAGMMLDGEHNSHHPARSFPCRAQVFRSTWASALSLAEISSIIVMLITLPGHSFAGMTRGAQKRHKNSAR